MHRYQATHRRAPRLRPMRTGALVGALALSLVIGSAGILTQLQGGSASADALVADSTEPAIVRATLPPVEPPATTDEAGENVAAVPADSGQGRRIVFSEGQQRVWLVDDSGDVERTYLVSGSKHDNLDQGTYEVTSRDRHATSYDYSGTMEFFVRFASGENAAIGFHSVPVDNDGKLHQSKDELGTALSAGCVRQWRDDAVALWKFAPVGTPVVVTA